MNISATKTLREANPALFEIAVAQFAASHPYPGGSIHSIHHWERVAANGIELGMQEPGCIIPIVVAFAMLHDCCRENEYEDQEHGRKAGKFSQLDKVRVACQPFYFVEDDWNILFLAISEHNVYHKTSTDPTIGVCWDADRLDLWRVGLTKGILCQMSTGAGRYMARERGYK